MNKLKAFAYVFKKSLTSIKYYKEVVQTNVSFSLKYYILLCLLLTVITVLVGIIPQTPKITEGANKFADEIAGLYPQDLVLTMKTGELSVNQPEPIKIALPSVLTDANISEAEKAVFPENLIVFDAAGTVDNIKDYKTLILVNKVNALIYGNDKIDVYALKDIPDGSLTKQQFENELGKLRGYIQYIPAVLAGIAVLGSFLYYFGFRMVSLLIVGLILWAVGKAKGLPLSYSKYFKIALHAATLPLLVETVITLTVGTVQIPLWFFVLNCAVGVMAVFELTKPVQGEAEVTEVKKLI